MLKQSYIKNGQIVDETREEFYEKLENVSACEVFLIWEMLPEDVAIDLVLRFVTPNRWPLWMPSFENPRVVVDCPDRIAARNICLGTSYDFRSQKVIDWAFKNFGVRIFEHGFPLFLTDKYDRQYWKSLEWYEIQSVAELVTVVHMIHGGAMPDVMSRVREFLTN